MRRESRDPYGYKKLLAYRKAGELQQACAEVTRVFVEGVKREEREKGEEWGGKGLKTILALADQMDRSARSVKQNIVEGWKRNSTKEYHQFLGFSLGANAELEEDCNDIIKGIYKGIEREKEDWDLERVEKLPFYPLDPRLPPLIQLKLRCKELNFLLRQLQDSLEQKMREPAGRVFASAWGSAEERGAEREYGKLLAGHGMARLPDGRVVKREEGV